MWVSFFGCVGCGFVYSLLLGGRRGRLVKSIVPCDIMAKEEKSFGVWFGFGD
jgi:hypothetical protein